MRDSRGNVETVTGYVDSVTRLPHGYRVVLLVEDEEPAPVERAVSSEDKVEKR